MKNNLNSEDYNRGMEKIRNQLEREADVECRDIASNKTDINRFIDKIYKSCERKCPANFTAASQKELELECLSDCSEAKYVGEQSVMAYFHGLEDGQSSCPTKGSSGKRTPTVP